MKNKTKITVIAGVIALVTATIALNDDKATPSVVLENPIAITWEKPETDAEWIKDVEQEQLNMRPTETLKTMRDAHLQKLEKMLTNNLVTECPECVSFEIKRELQLRLDSGEKLDSPLEEEVEKLVSEKINQYQRDIETLTRSIERMEKELDLRERGVVREVRITSAKNRPVEEARFNNDEIIRYVYD